jgi:DNA-binding CsgD family transcriptional regulator
MPADRDMLKRLASEGHAVMEIDYSERVTAWNREAEDLLGIPSREALGRPCYEVLQGRDVFGNRYCHRACPIAHQARFQDNDPVRVFPLDVEARTGGTRRVILSTFARASSRPSLAPIVHVFQKDAKVKRGSRRGALLAAAPIPEREADAVAVILTPREKEVLRSIAEGLPTQAIAERLGILTVTVRNHVQAILRRLKVHNRLAAVHLARQRKLL